MVGPAIMPKFKAFNKVCCAKLRTSPDFSQIIVISLILLPLNKILRFGKRMKSHDAKYGKQERCALVTSLSLARNMCIEKAECAAAGHKFGSSPTCIQTLHQNAMN
jgi:hypothetical protein